MNGRKLYVKPPTTAELVNRRLSFSMMPMRSSRPSRLTARITASTGPLLPSNVCQAMVRNRKLVKNGTITKPMMRLR